MFVGWLLSMATTGLAYAFSRSFFYAAAIIWAYEELFDGVNWFRRTLGFLVLLLMLSQIAGDILQ